MYKARVGLIWAVDPESLRLATRIAKRNNAKLIYDAHEFHREESPKDNARRKWVIREENAAATSIDQLVTVNEAIAKLYKVAIPNSNPVVIRNLIDPVKLDREASPLRVAVGSNEETKILLYHGSLREYRHLRELALAANKLSEEWKVVFLGDGPLKNELRALSSSAYFLDMAPYEELAHWVSGADLGVILYEDVGLNQHYCSPNKLYEYIANGIPFIATDLPSLKHYAETYQCGIVIRGNITPELIANTIASIGDERLAEQRTNCVGISSSLSWNNEKQKITNILKSLNLDKNSNSKISF